MTREKKVEQTKRFQRRFHPEDAPRRRRFGFLLFIALVLVLALLYQYWPAQKQYIDIYYLAEERELRIGQKSCDYQTWASCLLEAAEELEAQGQLRLFVNKQSQVQDFAELLQLIQALDKPWTLKSFRR